MSCSQLKKNKNACSSLSECINLASQLTKKKYLYEELNDREFNNAGDVVWTSKNSDALIGELLAYSGYARIEMKEKGFYQVINARDIRYTALPSYSATKKTNDELPPPNTADYAELVYESQNGFNRPAQMARNLRTFMSRYGRVMDHKFPGLLIIRDNLAIIHQSLALIRKMDVPISKEEKEEYEKSYNYEILREKTRQETLSKLKEFVENKKKEEKTEGSNK